MAGKEDAMENSAKIRILYLMEILNRFSDEDHPLSTSQIIFMVGFLVLVERFRFLGQNRSEMNTQ